MNHRGQTSFVANFSDLKREYRADYEAARSGTRFRRNRTGLYGTADAHYSNERSYFETIEYIRDMERNDPLVGPTLNIVCNQLMQGGFQYEPQTGDKGLDQDLKADFLAWSTDPLQFDRAGEVNFRQSELLVCRHEIRDGDLFVLPNLDGSMQFAECERARTPRRTQRNIVHGVEIDRTTRRRVRYWFTKGNVDIFQRIESTSEMDAIDAVDDEGFPQVFHLFDKTRITQTRGISAFTAAMLRMGMLEDVEMSLVLKQQMAACVVFSEETHKDGYVSAGEATGRRDTLPGTGGDVVNEDIVPGLYKRLAPGKKLTIHSPNIPSTETMQHIRSIIQLIGLQVGLPVIMMLMDARETNFSGWRGAVDTARQLFRQGQRRRRDMYHRNVAIFRTRWLMSQPRTALGKSLRAAEKRLGRKIYDHVWRLPSWPYIQPMHDAQARALRLSTLQTSPRREAAEDGQDFSEVAAETIADNEQAIGAAIEAAERLNSKAGKSIVHWRDILNRDVYQGGSVTDSVDVDNSSNNPTSADSL